VLCLYFLLASSVSGLFRCPKAGKTFTEDGCATCHICHQDLSPTSLPTCENGTLCDITLGYCQFKDQVVCPSELRVGWHRTVIFVEKETEVGQDLFIRGGISNERRAACTNDARTSDCALDIRVREIGKGSGFDQYNAYKNGDRKLDFYGAEMYQATYHGQEAAGTAMQWTTNNKNNSLYNHYNRGGDNYWMLDMEMNCEQTENGWFELKTFLRGGEGWESDIVGDHDCAGNIGGIAPYQTVNHMARCGFVNIFHYGESECEINTIQSYDVINY